MTFGDGNVKYQRNFQTILEENLNYLYILRRRTRLTGGPVKTK